MELSTVLLSSKSLYLITAYRKTMHLGYSLDRNTSLAAKNNPGELPVSRLRQS